MAVSISNIIPAKTAENSANDAVHVKWRADDHRQVYRD
jgi:hypothetical protein